MAESFLLLESGGHIVLENGSGDILLESSGPPDPPPAPLGLGGNVWLRRGNTPRIELS